MTRRPGKTTRFIHLRRPVMLSPVEVKRLCDMIQFTVQIGAGTLPLDQVQRLVDMHWRLRRHQAVTIVADPDDADERMEDLLVRLGYVDPPEAALS